MQLQVIESGNIVIQKRDYRGPKDRGSEGFNFPIQFLWVNTFQIFVMIFKRNWNLFIGALNPFLLTNKVGQQHQQMNWKLVIFQIEKLAS